MPNYAGFLIRLQAHLIDVFLWALTLTVSALLIANAQPTLNELFPSLAVWLYYLAFLLPLLTLLYKILLTTRYGGSLGKLVSGIKVMDEEGKLLKFWPAAFRYLVGYIVSGLFLWMGFFWIIRDNHKQGWHDQLSGTFVLRAHPRRWATGALLLLALIALNVTTVWRTVQLIKENETLHTEFRTLIEETRLLILENEKRPATIESQNPGII